MIAEDNPCATPFWTAMASSTVPEYFNKYKTGAKFAVQFRMCYLPQQLPV
jgi:hypothetical protein